MVLLLEDWIFNNSSPNDAILIITGLESMVLSLSERAMLLAMYLLKDGGTI